MKNITWKVILSIIICSLSVIVILGSVSYYNSEKVFNVEMKEKLIYASGKYANEFNMVFQKQQGVVDSVSAAVSVLFDTAEYENNRQLFERHMAAMDEIVKETISKSGSVMALYVTFNPEACKGRDEIWYIIDQNGCARRTVAREINDEKWLDEKNQYDDYYFDAIKYGSVWSGAFYDLGLKEDTLSYSKAVYDKRGKLIGVVGADILADDIVITVQDMKIYEGDQSVLLDSDYKYIIGSGDKNTFLKFYTHNFKEKISKIDNGNGIFHYRLGGDDYIVTCAKLYNGWRLIISQPEEVATAPIDYTEKIVISLGLVIIAAIIAFAVIFSRKSFRPILEEAEKKDIMIINQSRQAKLGEMVGNIAHQWKQPLNAMNITLSNMTDDFHHHELDEAAYQEHLARMQLSIKTMSSTVDDFADFLKPDRQREEFCINDEVKKALKLMEESIKLCSITVDIQGDENVTITGFRNEFSQGVFNVLDNARDAIIESDPAERLITINVKQFDAKDGKEGAEICIINKGRPISPDVMQKLFQPYFTTKADKKGTGIGLYITKQIIEEHMNGSIEFRNEEDGVCCRISVLSEV